MTKEEARKAMEQGQKVKHRYFSDNEFIHIVDGKMLTEDGYNFEARFTTMTGNVWKAGWSVID